MFIQDLLEPTGKFTTHTHLNKKYNVTIDIMTLNSIISAIPTKWKKLINSDNNIKNYKVFLDCKVDINEQSRKLIEITTKDVYDELINRKATRPTTENTWQEKVGLNFDDSTWALIYRNPYKITREAKLIAFHFKIMHRIIACKKNLCTWKIEANSICDYCGQDVDVIEHFLVTCPDTFKFWNRLFTWWKSTFQTFIATDTYDIIFGMVNENDDIFITN
jgi:hypothetical protein